MKEEDENVQKNRVQKPDGIINEGQENNIQ